MESQQHTTGRGAGRGRKAVASIGQVARFRVARLIVRRRAGWAYFVLTLWTGALTVLVMAWALHQIPAGAGSWIYYAGAGCALVFQTSELVEKTVKVRRRWRELG